MRNSYKFILFGLILSILFVGATNAAPAITPTPGDASFTNVTDDLPFEFSITVNESSNITWYFDGSLEQSSAINQIFDSYSKSASVGLYNVTVFAENVNGTDSHKWDWIVNESLAINGNSPGPNPSTTVGDEQTFTVDTNQLANIEWYIDGALVQTNASQTSASYTNSTAPVDSYSIKATANNVNGTADQIWTWDVTAIPAPSITLVDPTDLTPNDNTGDSRTFEVSINQPVNLTWIMNGTTLRTDNSVTTSSYAFISVPENSSGHNLTVFAQNANGTDQEKWDWTVTDIPLSITDSKPTSDPETTVDVPQIFNITVNKVCDINWYIDSSLVQTNSSSADAEFTKSDASVGNYNVTVTATNSTDNVSKSWTWDVRSKTYFSGDRIWDENAGQSTDYEWNAKSFSGFFYDLESGLSSETLTISDIDRSIGDDDIVYETRPVETDFEHSEWGKYQVIGFMAEKYFAAYTVNTSINDVEIISMMSDGQLAKVLIDDDEKESVFSGSSLVLEEGYELKIVEVDVNGNSVFVRLVKDGDELDSGVVSGNEDYIYQVDVGDSDDVVLIAVHFDNIFSGTESNAVFVEGIFQISDEYTQVENGDSFGKMEVTSVGDTMIQMKNDDSVSLSKGKTVDIMGKIKLIVADDDDLRFAPFVDMSEPGTYELRGTVAEGSELLTWTPLNFEGFYYDIDEGIQTENLEVLSISSRSIDDDQLVYTSTPQAVEFEHSEWNSFNVIGFQAEKYFAGYPSTAFDRGESVDLISDGQLSKVILDEDEKRSVFSGSSLTLGEGYTLDIVEVDRDGNQVLVELSKDGDEVDTDIASANDDYIYEKDLGDSDDVPIIVVHFDEIFRGSESNAVFVEGIFQISDEYKELETGDTFGEMEITSLGGSIVMKNDDSISLSKDNDIEIMENVGIRVADSDTVRYYPYTEVTTSPDEELKVTIKDSVALKGEEFTITVTSRGASVAEASVEVEGTKIGETDDEGRIDYTPSEVGVLDVVAEKEGYVSGTDEIEVIDPDDETRKISIEVSPEEIFEGSPMTIYVLKSIGGDAIQGADVTFDGKSLGSTSSDGTITYTPTEPGMHKLEATKSGMLDAELDFKVEELAAKFEFSNLVITPVGVKQGNEATFNVDVENTGTAAGDYTVELKVNGTVVGSQTISMEVGDTQTLEFKHAEEEPGTYLAIVGGLEQTYEVVEKSSVLIYALGAIVLAVAGGLGYLFTAGGWTVEMAQAKVGEAIVALKELIGNVR